MKLRTRKKTEQTPRVLHIPKKIEQDITEKWFHLYKWISPEEVKLSIERDFLKVLKYTGTPLAIIACLVGFISGLSIPMFLGTIFIGVFFIFLYLFFLSLRRSYLLSKSAFVVLTDSSISLGGKVQKLSEISKLRKDIDEVSETFEEDLFGKSGLSESKDGLLKSVMEQLFGWYKAILKVWDNNRWFGKSKDSAQAMLIIIGLYTAYIAIMGSVYFMWVLWLLLFGKLLVWLNKKYLILRGQNVLKINEHFGNIDILSEEISAEKQELKKHLKNAQKWEWKDGLLLEINAGIENINNSANFAVDEVRNLKREIENSSHKDMFSFPVYNAWIKKQIATPLSQIQELLSNTRSTLEVSLQEISEHIKAEKRSEYLWALKLQEKRIKSQIKDIKKFLPLLENALKNLSEK